MSTTAVDGQQQSQSKPTVASCAQSCVESFQDCLNKASNADKITRLHHPKLLLVRVEDQLARFSLWTANIRVFGSGRDSLDHRLREVPDVQDAVIGLLQALEYRVKTCSRILDSIGSKTADGLSETLLKEFDDALEGLKNEITLLHKISNTIRRASKDTQNVNAAKTFKVTDDQGNDVESFLQQLFANHIRDQFPGISDNLRQRLADSMVLRRKRILYRRARYGRTPIRPPEVVSKPAISHPKPEPTAEIPREPVKRRVVASASQSAVQSMTQTATTLSPENFQRASNPSVISVSKTVALSSHDELCFPPAPCGGLMRRYNRLKREKEERHRTVVESIPGYREHGKPPPLYVQLNSTTEAKQKEALAKDWDRCLEAIGEVTCPFCFYALQVQDAVDERKWKLHVKNDLDPYVCLFGECDSGEQLYNHSGAWLKHMREHALRWRCASKSHGEFVADARNEYLNHIKTSHPGKFTDAQLGVLADRNARMTGPLFKSCPLCGIEEVVGSMEDHIVGHMRFLALKSLPTYQDTDGLEEEPESQQDSLTTSRPHSRSTIRNDTERYTPLVFRDSEDNESMFSDLHKPSKYASWGGFRNYISQFPGGENLPPQTADSPLPAESEASPSSHKFVIPPIIALHESTVPRDPSAEFVDDDLFVDVPEGYRRRFEWGFIPDAHGSSEDMVDDPIIRAFLERQHRGMYSRQYSFGKPVYMQMQGQSGMRQQSIIEFLDSIAHVFPGAQTPEPTAAPVRDSAPITSLASAQAATSAQGKRTRSGRRAQSDSDDEQYESQRYNPRRKTIISHSPYLPPPPSTALHTQNDETRPTYPRFIAHAIRELVDEDFEDSCEYCFCYLYEPYKYIKKPFTSCGRPRAEVSHILRHAVSDHGLIRGHHSGRKSQRYLARCASHNAEVKGKAACIHCKGVEYWTEEDLANEGHAGESVCIRCYTQLHTKADLFRHLNEPNICVYNEDWAMRKKVRILYSTFCAPNKVPKFQPPPGAELRGDGARKRNLKANQRPSAQAALSQNKPPQPASAYSAAASSHQDLDMYSESVMSQQYVAYQNLDWLVANPPLLSVPILPAQPVQNTAGWQHGARASGKFAGDVQTDSGFGSTLEEDFSEYFNNAIRDMQPG